MTVHRRQADSAAASPLSWPDGWPRTLPARRRRASFAVSFGRARDELVLELSRMGAAGIVVSTNLPLRRDGLPYARCPEPDDPGVAVYWMDAATRRRMAMACDRWDRVRDNLRAVGKTIEALRGIERWASSTLLDRAFTGFAALPEPAHDLGNWRRLFGFAAHDAPSLDTVRRLYRRRVAEIHPDRGGSHDAMVQLNAAMAAAEVELA